MDRLTGRLDIALIVLTVPYNLKQTKEVAEGEVGIP